MSVFFVQLVKKLDEENKQWRKDTVILLDNAKYHRSKEILTLLKELHIPVLFTGPHSYAAVPIELWFAAFKADDINPRHLPTDKK